MSTDVSSTPSASPARFSPLRGWAGGLLCVAGGGALSAALMSLPARQAEPAAPAPVAEASTAGAEAQAGGRPQVRPGRADGAAQPCANCGVVESVTAQRQEGKGTGLGAVAGGVLGGVVGHQMGNGNGKKAMTVLGAVGGGFAGHEVEKHARSVTVHRVKVRMEDGSLRTVTQREAPAIGARVRVENKRLVPVEAD